MRDYAANPKNNIGHKGTLILCGLTHKDTGKPAWAIPGGTFTTSKKEAARIAAEVYKLRSNEK